MHEHDPVTPTNTVFILGASDPEMERISAWIHHGEGIVVMAANRARRWVSPSEAYAAQTIIGSIPRSIRPMYHVLIECDGPACKKLPGRRIVIDHHAKGHPGFGGTPQDYWRSSSLGQLARLFGWGLDPLPYPVYYRIKQTPWPAPPFAANVAAYVAAADHCLRAAYAGQCPGVDPKYLAEWRVAEKARYKKVPTLHIERQIHEATIALIDAPSIELAPGINVKDLRGSNVPELPEASALIQEGFLSTLKLDNRIKYTCMGSAEQVTAFLSCWAPNRGLTGLYGDPVRGYAGGFE